MKKAKKLCLQGLESMKNVVKCPCSTKDQQKIPTNLKSDYAEIKSRFYFFMG